METIFVLIPVLLLFSYVSCFMNGKKVFTGLCSLLNEKEDYEVMDVCTRVFSADEETISLMINNFVENIDQFRRVTEGLPIVGELADFIEDNADNIDLMMGMFQAVQRSGFACAIPEMASFLGEGKSENEGISEHLDIKKMMSVMKCMKNHGIEIMSMIMQGDQ